MGQIKDPEGMETKGGLCFDLHQPRDSHRFPPDFHRKHQNSKRIMFMKDRMKRRGLRRKESNIDFSFISEMKLSHSRKQSRRGG